jgi:hypothetical protein
MQAVDRVPNTFITIDKPETPAHPRTVKINLFPESMDPNRPLTAGRVFKYIFEYTIGLPYTLLKLIAKVICLAFWTILDKAYGGFVEKNLLPALGKNEKFNHLSKVEFDKKLEKAKEALKPKDESFDRSCLYDDDSDYLDSHEFRYFSKFLTFSDPSNQCSSLKLQTPDGVKLDAAICWNKKEDYEAWQAGSQAMTKCANKKWIIYFYGNGGCYEHKLKDSIKLAQEYDANILMFNYRGVMDSEGYPKSAQDLVLDGHTSIQFLKDQGILSDEMLLEGFSLGGGVGTQVAALHPEINFVNRSSFCSISKLAACMVYENTLGKDEANVSCARKVLASVVSFFAGGVVKGALWVKKWDLDSVSVWDKIKGHKWIITSQNDEAMRGEGKFYKGLKKKKYWELIKNGYKKINILLGNSDQNGKNEKAKELVLGYHIKAKGYTHNTVLEGHVKDLHKMQINIALHNTQSSLCG